MKIGLFLIIGLVAGIYSGFFGLGGGLIIIPGLIYLAGYTMHQAMGTSLGALLLPVGALGVWEYYKNGHVDIKIALVIGVGLFLGAYFGARWAQSVSPTILKKIFSIFLLVMAVKMFLEK